MPAYVCATRRATQKAQHFDIDLDGRLAPVRKAIQSHPTLGIALRKHFHPIGPFWRARWGAYRPIAVVRRVGEDTFVCLVDILSDTAREYQKFCLDPDQPAPTDWTPTDDELRALRAGLPPQTVSPPPPPPELEIWLSVPSITHSATGIDCVIYESEGWVEHLGRYASRWWQSLCECVADAALTRLEGISAVDFSLQRQAVQVDPVLTVFYQTFPIVPEPQIGALNIDPWVGLFLHDVCETKDAPQVEQQLKARGALFERPNSGVSLTSDQVARRATKAYPWYVADNRLRLWHDIATGTFTGGAAHLALSGEEQGLLLGLRFSRSALPFFLNGRAGSGKSTMLYYLFAAYLRLRYDPACCTEGDPLFLCSSDELLTKAAESVVGLLESDPQAITIGRTVANQVRENRNVHFKTFRRLYRELLGHDDAERFPESRRLTFVRFRALFLERFRFGGRPGSPELCWHVIRSLIKGYATDRLLHPSDYPEIARREQPVTLEVFERIYNQVWLRWLSQEPYWDDLDLARKAAEQQRLPSYPVILCDEAQDLTRLELSLLMRLSTFSAYDVTRTPLRNLPLCLAGDPYQTVNPTGFRWEAVRAMFHEEVLDAIDPYRTEGFQCNYKVLTYNYRSNASIVAVANALQRCRAGLFRIAGLEEQSPWREQSSHAVLKLILDSNAKPPPEFWDAARPAVILIPAEEGEEAEWVKADPILRSAPADFPKSVMSAAKAKGLEFDIVILYKWGESCDSGLWGLAGREDVSREETIPHEYFFNRLYVAVTRAIRQLIIIDTAEGDQRLWRRVADYASSPYRKQESMQVRGAPGS